MKNLAFLFLFFSLSLDMSAQLQFDGGVKLGAITSQVAGDTYAGYNKLGITGGAFVEAIFSEKNSAQLEILYAQKGSRNKPNTKNGDFSYYRLVLNYIEIPVSYIYHRDRLDFEGGLYYGILLNSSQDTGSGEMDVVPPYLKYDFGGQLGVGYDLMEDKLAFVIVGSSSILPTRKAPTNPNPGLAFISGGFNAAISFSLEYSF